LPILHSVGVRSVPVVAITGTFIGMVLAVQSYSQFHQLGLETQLGSIINLSIVRELGPVLAATMLAGRVGGAMAAELATMRVTEQIDALACLGVNPVHYLAAPRFLACVLLIPVLTVVANFMGVLGGALICVDVYHVDAPRPAAVVATGVDAVRRAARAARHRPGGPARRHAGGHRRERLRQDGAAQADRRAAEADGGPGAVRRPFPGGPARARADEA